jgi:hypothetical protein
MQMCIMHAMQMRIKVGPLQTPTPGVPPGTASWGLIRTPCRNEGPGRLSRASLAAMHARIALTRPLQNAYGRP